MEAAAERFVDHDDRSQVRDAFTQAVEVYTSLGAAADVARLQAAFRAHGIRRGSRQGPASTQRLGQPDRDRDQDRRVGGRGAVQSRDRRPATAIRADRCDPTSCTS